MPASSSDTRPLVIVRADASAAIGLGHVMRSLTLAGALAEEGCDVRFIGAGIPAAAGSNLPGAVQVSDRPDVAGDEVDAASVLAERPDLVVVDGYHFTAVFFRALENAGTPYAVIDDNLETSARAPVLVLNQNPHASAELYGELQGAPVLLLGLEYALIRPEIVATAQLDLAREPGVVFVSMGGSDPLGLTLPIVERLARPGVRVLVALGPAHPSRTETSERLTGLDGVHVIARVGSSPLRSRDVGCGSRAMTMESALASFPSGPASGWTSRYVSRRVRQWQIATASGRKGFVGSGSTERSRLLPRIGRRSRRYRSRMMPQ